jgi:hypothetical protein
LYFYNYLVFEGTYNSVDILAYLFAEVPVLKIKIKTLYSNKVIVFKLISIKILTHPPPEGRGMRVLFVIGCVRYAHATQLFFVSFTNNKEQTTKRRTAIPPIPRRNGLPAAFVNPFSPASPPPCSWAIS